MREEAEDWDKISVSPERGTPHQMRFDRVGAGADEFSIGLLLNRSRRNRQMS